MKKELATLLNNYDRRLKEKREQEEKVRKVKDIFLTEFKRLRVEVIKPVMEQIGSQLKERGHDYSIEEGEERKDARGGTLDAYITMNIFPSEAKQHEYGPSSTPYISFRAITYKKMITVFGSTMMPKREGSSGPRVSFGIGQTNEDLVTREILEMLKEIFKR